MRCSKQQHHLQTEHISLPTQNAPNGDEWSERGSKSNRILSPLWHQATNRVFSFSVHHECFSDDDDEMLLVMLAGSSSSMECRCCCCPLRWFLWLCTAPKSQAASLSYWSSLLCKERGKEGGMACPKTENPLARSLKSPFGYTHACPGVCACVLV